MTNPTSTPNQRVRFEEITPTNEIVAYFKTQLSDLVAGRGLPILFGYDDLDDIQFSFVTLPSGNTVVLGQYENAPEIGVDLYVELNLSQNPQATADKIPDLVIETCQYLAIPRSTAIWFHPDYEQAIDKSYPSDEEIAKRSESLFRSPEIFSPSEPIDCFYYALDIYPREKIPEYWAMLQHNLGLAYYHRTEGERWRNLQESIACFNRSLQVFTEDEFPQKWQINREDLDRSIAEWVVEKQNLIRDIFDRPGESLNLSNANLSGVDLSGAYLGNSVVLGSSVVLSGDYLSSANLSGANLSGANLSGANLNCTNLSGADLSGADVENTRFGFNGISELMRRDLTLRGAIFEDFPGDRFPSETPSPVSR